MPIPKSTASKQALERLVEVMRAQLGAEITAIADSGLVMKTPGDTDYYITNQTISPVVGYGQIEVYVFQEGAFIPLTEPSGDGTILPMKGMLPVTVALRFRVGDADPKLTVQGKTQTLSELHYHLAERYKGALIECLCTYAPDDISICQIALESDESFVQELQGDAWGQAVIRVQLLQSVTLPMWTSPPI